MYVRISLVPQPRQPIDDQKDFDEHRAAGYKGGWWLNGQPIQIHGFRVHDYYHTTPQSSITSKFSQNRPYLHVVCA